MFRHSLVAFALIALAGSASAQQAAAPQWQEGKTYTLIANPQPTNQPDKVVVTEVFSFGCPACNRFEPFIDKLKAELPKGAVLEFVPASFIVAEDWPVFQRAYLTAKALGIDAKSHDAMFHAIHDPDGPLATIEPGTNRLKTHQPTIEDVAAFYAKFGVKPATFVATANSFAINMQMKRADKQIMTWGITGTPTLVIDGKYKLGVTSSKGPQEAVDQTLYLVRKELATKQGK